MRDSGDALGKQPASSTDERAEGASGPERGVGDTTRRTPSEQISAARTSYSTAAVAVQELHPSVELGEAHPLPSSHTSLPEQRAFFPLPPMRGGPRPSMSACGTAGPCAPPFAFGTAQAATTTSAAGVLGCGREDDASRSSASQLRTGDCPIRAGRMMPGGEVEDFEAGRSQVPPTTHARVRWAAQPDYVSPDTSPGAVHGAPAVGVGIKRHIAVEDSAAPTTTKAKWSALTVQAITHAPLGLAQPTSATATVAVTSVAPCLPSTTNYPPPTVTPKLPDRLTEPFVGEAQPQQQQRPRLPHLQPMQCPDTAAPQAAPPLAPPSDGFTHKPLSTTSGLPDYLYRLLRLCFLRRWPRQMWQVCASVYDSRRATRSDDEDGDDERGGYEAEGGGYCNAVAHVGRRTLASVENSADLMHRSFHESFRDGEGGDREGPSSVSFTRAAAPYQQLAVGETRRRDRGSSVSPTTGRGRRDRFRGNRVLSHTHNGSISTNRGGWTVLEGCRLFLTFACCCCCCCCCPGRSCHGGRRWVARALHPMYALWMRYRVVVWCLVTASFLLFWFVALPLATSVAVSLMESEFVFVQRMRFIGLPREVDPSTEPPTVLVQRSTLPMLERSDADREGAGDSHDDTLISATAAAAARAHAAHVALQALRLTVAQRCLAAVPLLGSRRLKPSQLPPWTLYPIMGDGKGHINTGGHAAAGAGASEQPFDFTTQANTGQATALQVPLSPPTSAIQQGIFAASSTPLGRIGPMLLAITSVTDGIAIADEITKWPWIPRVSRHDALLRAVQRGATPTHLAVLGIPSSDHPARAALRSSQRRTWLAYSDVARTENNFTSRLLVLYVLAASEHRPVRSAPRGRTPEQRATTASWLSQHSLEGYLSRDAQRLGGDVSLMLPTVSEFAAAAEFHAVASLLSRQAWRPAPADLPPQRRAAALESSYVQRRMTLRKEWELGDGADSPCDTLIDQTVSTHASTWNPRSTVLTHSAFLSTYLELPVQPLFTVPAHMVCHASTALWQEALAHRNVLWVDMMTDRRPTSKKKLGEAGHWGLPVEVGMSQKLILWLEYAYHAFPDVPYIMKGDDDTYLKVPQFVRDLRYIRGGRRDLVLDELTRTSGPPTASSAADGRALKAAPSAFTVGTPMANDLRSRSTEACVYWGSMRRWNGELYFSAGMLLLLHRHLVQTVLEERPEYNNDVIRLAARAYSPLHAHTYFAAMMDHEDVMIGKVLAERQVRAMQLCPFHRHWYVWEHWDRFHDVHRGRIRNVTWSTVAAHRCTPTDFLVLHDYFQHEYSYGRDGAAEDDAVARQQAQARLEALRRGGGDAAGEQRENGAGTSQRGNADAVRFEGLPDVLWATPTEMNHKPLPFVLSAADNVAVYEVEYTPFSDGYLVLNGWVSATRLRSARS